MRVFAVPRSIARSRDRTLWSQSSTVVFVREGVRGTAGYERFLADFSRVFGAIRRGSGPGEVLPDPRQHNIVEHLRILWLQDPVPLVGKDEQLRLDPESLQRGVGRERLRDGDPIV